MGARRKEPVLAIRFTDDEELRRFLDNGVRMGLIPDPHAENVVASPATALDGIGSVRGRVFFLCKNEGRMGEQVWPRFTESIRTQDGDPKPERTFAETERDRS